MKKIGIVTSVKELNYGAVLQAYALQSFLEKKEYDVSMLWWSNQRESHADIRAKKLLSMGFKMLSHPSLIQNTFKVYGASCAKEFSEKSKLMFDEFAREYLNIEYFNGSEMKRFAYSQDCLAVMAGSDQIWNSYAVYVDPFYYLRFAPVNKRIAYAPSLGKSDIPVYNKKKMKKYIEGIKYVSVRERKGKALIDNLLDTDVPVVLDPTFLLNKEDWKKISKPCNVKSKKYNLFYFLDEPSDMCISCIKKILKDSGLPIIAMPYKLDGISEFGNVEYADAGPLEFLDLIENADIIFTDSFHGTALSINYNKNFYVFDRQYGSNQSQVSRIADLLDTFKLENRFISDEKLIINQEIDYNSVNEKLKELRHTSNEYLDSALRDIRGNYESN